MDPLAAILALVVVLAAAWERRQLLAALAAEREQWREERSELLERIQRPQVPPIQRATSTEPREAKDPPADLSAYRRVGVAMPIADGTER